MFLKLIKPKVSILFGQRIVGGVTAIIRSTDVAEEVRVMTCWRLDWSGYAILCQPFLSFSYLHSLNHDLSKIMRLDHAPEPQGIVPLRFNVHSPNSYGLPASVGPTNKGLLINVKSGYAGLFFEIIFRQESSVMLFSLAIGM
jgi:hypothetical protein